MPTVNPLTNIPGGLMPTTTTSTPSADIDRDGFMRLLVAQLQNQDPLEPLSNEEFVQQLTSFSSLDELRSISKGIGGLERLEEISELMTANLALQQTNLNALAVGLIGKEVEAVSDKVQLGYDSDSQISFMLPESGASEVTVQLEGTGGTVYSSITFNPTQPPEGVQVDGRKVIIDLTTFQQEGANLPTGEVTIKASSKNNGVATPLETSLIGLVNGIDFSGSNTLLSVGGTPVNISHVLAVNNP